MCKQHEEDTLHALYHCPELQSLWMTTPSWNQDTLKQKTCFIDFIVSVFAGLKETELLMVVLWNLWKRRNNLRLGKPTIPLNKVLEHSQEQRIESYSNPLPSTTPRSKQPAIWTPPPEHWYKLNFDGATFADTDIAEVSTRSSKQTGTDPPMTDLGTSAVRGKFQTPKTNSRGSVGEFSPLKLAYLDPAMKLTKIQQFQELFDDFFCQNPSDLTRFMSDLVRVRLNYNVLAISSIIDGFDHYPT
nr:hypothetical protein CFP56_71505 [Quercus suber]